MKILITGGSGTIGLKLVKFFSGEEVYYTFFSNRHSVGKATPVKLDITNSASTVKTIMKIKPDVVIHAAALANMDMCETDKDAARKINIGGTKNVADGCEKSGSKMVYISTSAVFSTEGRKLTEEDKTNPVNYYGYTKLEGEKVSMKTGRCLVLRTDQPYCWIERWQKKSSVIRILERLKNHEPVREV